MNDKLEEVLWDLVDRANDYDDMGGVELTEEDAQRVLELTENGTDYETAIDIVLDGIVEVLSMGWD